MSFCDSCCFGNHGGGWGSGRRGSEVVGVEVDGELEVVLVDVELEVVLDVEVELVLVDVLVELCVDLLVLVSPPTVADGCPIIKYPK